MCVLYVLDLLSADTACPGFSSSDSKVEDLARSNANLEPTTRTLRLNQTHCVQEVLRHCAVAELYALQCTCKQQQTETRHFVEIQSNLFIAGVLCPRQYGRSGFRAASGSADADTTWKAESAVFRLGP